MVSIEQKIQGGPEYQPQGRKDDQGKLRFDLLPPRALEAVVRVLTLGAKEYGDRNWEKGMEWHRPFGAIQRHTWAFWGGEDQDPKTGEHPLAHAICECLFLLEYLHTHPELDDRPGKPHTGQKIIIPRSGDLSGTMIPMAKPMGRPHE